MSDYDAAFAAASGQQKQGADPYDSIMSSLMAPAPRIEPPASAPVSVKAGAATSNAISDIPRQVGLTARYGLEGLANTAQILTEPIRNALAGLSASTRVDSPLAMTRKDAPAMLPVGDATSRLLDSAGFPKPADANERVIGDATRLVAGAGFLGGLGRVASAAEGLTGQAGRLFSNNMGQQLTSAAGAGAAGGSVREAGGGPVQQGVASLLGGVVGGMLPQGAQATGNAIKGLVSRQSPQQLDQQISILLQRADVDYSALPAAARQALRNDLADALRTGQELDGAALRRLADFRAAGVTPTRGMVSQNPVQITREQNLAKIGANSSDEGLQGLALIQNRNNARLIQGMNELGAPVDPTQAGRLVAGSVTGTRDALRGAERAAWNEARATPGFTQPIYPDGLNAMNRALGDEGMMGFMNPTISRYMEAFQTGQQPFTPQAYRNLQSMLSNELAKGGNEAAAARIARQALESTPMVPITNPRGIDFGNMPVTAQTAAALRAQDAQAGNAISAIDRARAATRAAYAFEDSSPLVRSVLSGGAASDPTRIAQRFVIGGTPDEARAVAQQVGPQGREVIRNALVTQIKKEALNGASDEVGKVSQSSLNAAINKMGREKLALFFSPEELRSLQTLGRVASYMQVQPVGSAVNNSNSGALLLGKGLDALAGFANAVPVVGPMVAQPITNGVNGLNIAIRTRQAQNVLPGLLTPVERPPVGASLLLPSAAVGGLLAAP